MSLSRRVAPVGRCVAVVLVSALAAVVLLAVVAVGSSSDVVGLRTVVGDDGHRRVFAGDELVRFDGAGPERWAARSRRVRVELVGVRGELRAQRRTLRRERNDLRKKLRAERRVLLADPSVTEALNLAGTVYGNGATLWRKARCETGGTFNPRSLNSSSGAAGLLQFLPSTWRSTPYAGFSVWSPYANALAAGWMHSHGRGGEWACQ